MALMVKQPIEIDCPTVPWTSLVNMARAGDLIFEWSHNPIANAIENITDGPSHVIQIADFPDYDIQLYEFEAVFAYGVRLLPLSHYDHQSGYRILCRREYISAIDLDNITGRALSMLGRKYEVIEEVEIALKHLAPWVTVGETDNRVFCSGLIQYTFQGSSVEFEQYAGNATPEFLFKDPKTKVICKCAPDKR